MFTLFSFSGVTYRCWLAQEMRRVLFTEPRYRRVFKIYSSKGGLLHTSVYAGRWRELSLAGTNGNFEICSLAVAGPEIIPSKRHGAVCGC